MCVCAFVQSSNCKEEGLTPKNFKHELGISLISFSLSKPLLLMISTPFFQKVIFFFCLLLFNRGPSLYLSLNLLHLQANFN